MITFSMGGNPTPAIGQLVTYFVTGYIDFVALPVGDTVSLIIPPTFTGNFMPYGLMMEITDGVNNTLGPFSTGKYELGDDLTNNYPYQLIESTTGVQTGNTVSNTVETVNSISLDAATMDIKFRSVVRTDGYITLVGRLIAWGVQI